MSVSTLEQEIVVQVQRLAYAQQQQVLAFIHTLTQRPQGVAGHTLRAFAGSIDQASLQAMQDAITDACEKD